MNYQTLLTRVENGVGLITLNRPEALNALNEQLTRELSHAVDGMEADSGIGAIVLAGSDKAFAAGADIKEIKDKTFIDVFSEQFITASWERIASVRIPEHPPTHSDNMRPPVPGYPPTCDALP